MIRLELVDACEMPGRLSAYAVHQANDLIFRVRGDASAQQVAAAVTRLGGDITREAIDAATGGRPTAAQ